MEALLRDLQYSLRQIGKSPAFTALATLTLACGIGTNTAMFTVFESVLLRSLPYSQPERILYLGLASGDGFGSTSWLNYRDIRDQSGTLEKVAAYSDDVGVVQDKDGSVSVVTPKVTPSLFDILGVRPVLGRSFLQAEGEVGGPQVVLLSESLWRRFFNSNAGICQGRWKIRPAGRSKTRPEESWNTGVLKEGMASEAEACAA